MPSRRNPRGRHHHQAAARRLRTGGGIGLAWRPLSGLSRRQGRLARRDPQRRRDRQGRGRDRRARLSRRARHRGGGRVARELPHRRYGGHDRPRADQRLERCRGASWRAPSDGMPRGGRPPDRRAAYRATDAAAVGEGRSEIGDGARRRIVLVDSAAMVAPGDAGAIVVTGSHGGLVGGTRRSRYARRLRGVLDDAGIGVEEAGSDGSRRSTARRRGVHVGAASARSARRAPPCDGVISRGNEVCRPSRRGRRMQARDVLLAWAKG